MTARLSSSPAVTLEQDHCREGVTVLRYHGTSDTVSANGLFEIDTLCSAFDLIKATWADVEAAGRSGRIVIVAPATSALGEREHRIDAAVTGGMISLVRSLAIELSKSGATANTVLVDPAASSASADLLITALTSPDAFEITGQELYAAGAVSTGRLHP